MNSPYYYPNRPMLVPPDPETPMQPKPDYINSLETSGRWIAERKWNGDNCLLYTGTENGIPEFWGRRHEKLVYAATPEVLAEIRIAFPFESVINCELMHKHTKDIKNRLIAHTIMVWKGELLAGKTWGYARQLLETCTYGTHVIISELFKTGFWNLFNAADGANVEGIVLKDPNGLLKFSATMLSDVPFMLKIRKPCKKYNF